MMQFWDLFNVRYFRTGRSLLSDMVEMLAGRRKLSDCFSTGFLFIAGVILLGQVMIVNVAGDFFEVAPLSAKDWLQILLVTCPVLLIPGFLRSLQHHWRTQTDRRSIPRQ